MTWYAAIGRPVGRAVYGVGPTRDAALVDARRRGATGPLDTAPITPAADAYVRAYGGAPTLALEVSSARVSLDLAELDPADLRTAEVLDEVQGLLTDSELATRAQ